MTVAIKHIGDPQWHAMGWDQMPVTLPSHAAGDLMVIHLSSCGRNEIGFITPSGWTAVPGSTFTSQVGPGNNWLGGSVIYKIMESGAEPNPVVSMTFYIEPGDDIGVSVCYSFTGASRTNPIGDSLFSGPERSEVSNNVPFGNVTTTSPGDRVIGSAINNSIYWLPQELGDWSFGQQGVAGQYGVLMSTAMRHRTLPTPGLCPVVYQYETYGNHGGGPMPADYWAALSYVIHAKVDVDIEPETVAIKAAPRVPIVTVAQDLEPAPEANPGPLVAGLGRSSRRSAMAQDKLFKTLENESEEP